MSIFCAYLQFRAFAWLLPAAGRLLAFAALTALVVAAAPVTLVAAVGLAGRGYAGTNAAEPRHRSVVHSMARRRP